MMKVLKFFFTSLCILFLQACDDDDSVNNNVQPSSCTNMGENDPHCYGINTHKTPLEGIEEYRSEVLGEGDVVTFRWDETLAWFLKSNKHLYGFDIDPYAMYSEDAPLRGRDVYMSVEKGKDISAWVTIYVDPETVKVYHLHKIDENGNITQRDVINVSGICSKSTEGEKCKKDFPLSEGIYAVYYDTDDGEKDKERYLHILGYDKLPPYKVDFVQFGDALADDCTISEGGNGCYTQEWVEERFNEIMAQAVVEGKFNPLEAEDIGLDKFFTIDLTEQHNPIDTNDDTPVVGFMFSKIRKTKQYGYGNAIETFKNSYEEMKLYCTESGGTFEGNVTENRESFGYSYKCPGMKNENIAHFNGLASNVDRDFDRIEEAQKNVDKKHLTLGINKMRIQWTFEGGGKIVLNNHGVFKRAAEVMGITKLKMILEEIGKSAPAPVTVTVENRDEGNDRFEARIYGGPSLERKKIYRIYADVYPFVPEFPFKPNNPGAAQITYPYGNPVTGGIVWGSHLEGDASLNTIVHEIGHSFGLTDLFIADDDLSYPGNYTRYVKDPKNPVDAVPSFAFDESNIMWYAGDSGRRLRYRPLFVAGTGVGNRLHVKDSQGKYVIDSHGNYVYETEKQWDCIRSSKNCYRGEKK